MYFVKAVYNAECIELNNYSRVEITIDSQKHYYYNDIVKLALQNQLVLTQYNKFYSCFNKYYTVFQQYYYVVL